MRRPLVPLVPLVLLTLFLAPACGSSDDDGEQGEGDVVLAPEVRLLENHPEFESVDVAPDRLTYHFKSSADDIDAGEGNILVGASGGGYLRRATSAQVDGNTLELATENASLTQAILEGDLDMKLVESGSGDWSACGEGEACLEIDLIDLSDTVLYEGDVGGVPLAVRIPSGGLSFSPDVDFDMSIGFPGRIKRVSGHVTGTFDVDLEVQAEAGGAVELDREVDLSGEGKPLYSHPFTVVVPTPLGPLPIVGTVNLDVFVGFRARASAVASVSTGVSATAEIAVGATYEDGEWTPDADPSVEAVYQPVELGGEASTQVEAYARPEVSIIFYGVAGPRVALEPLLRLTNTLAPPDPLHTLLETCLRGELGFSIQILSFELADFSHSLERCLTLYDSNALATEALVVGAADGDVVIDTDAGTIVRSSDGASLRPEGVTFAREAQAEGQPALGIFSASEIAVEAGATVSVVGGGALVLRSAGDAVIGGRIDASGGRGSAQTAGPGGFTGGVAATGGGTAAGPGGGAAPTPLGPDSGGGGGGHAAAGGGGGARGPDAGGGGGALVVADDLAGGGGGGMGGGAGDGSGRGGGGGGAVRIEAAGAVRVEAGGLITAGGGGGEGGALDDGGGGGGAGGTIDIAAASIDVAGALAANGGGGGAGANQAKRGASGAVGGGDATPASGGAGAGEGRAGGGGGAGDALAGTEGDSAAAVEDSDDNAGGGGGAAGRILLRSKTVTGRGVISPAPGGPR
ncbi:MAG TPA: hypothetical protein VNO33_16260 [Kofleriaceae bacterium]|nr:hypothetical protein [Kofleriaceae bacterium]